MDVKRIPTRRVQIDPDNARTDYNQLEIEELADSIKAVGLLQPILVYKIEKTEDDQIYRVYAGNRRLMAMRDILKRTTIDAIILREPTGKRKFQVQMHENLKRKDISPIEEFEVINKTMKNHGVSVQTAADLLGKSATWVRERIVIEKLIEEAKDLLRQRQLGISHAKELAKLTPEDQEKCLEAIVINKGGQKHVVYTSIKLRQWIQTNIERNLDKAEFDTEDANLTSAPACSSCPKRSGNNTDLFGNTNGNICFDADCFSSKLEEHQRRNEHITPESPAEAKHLPKRLVDKSSSFEQRVNEELCHQIATKFVSREVSGYPKSLIRIIGLELFKQIDHKSQKMIASINSWKMPKGVKEFTDENQEEIYALNIDKTDEFHAHTMVKCIAIFMNLHTEDKKRTAYIRALAKDCHIDVDKVIKTEKLNQNA